MIVNVPSLYLSTVILRIPVISRSASTERISFAPTVPSVVPERRLSSSGVAEIVVVDGVVNGMRVPELSAKRIVLSVVGSTTSRVVSKSSGVVPSKVTFRG